MQMKDGIRQRGRIWWIKYYRDGRSFEESSRSTRRRVAEKLLRQRRVDSDQGLPVTPRIGRMRFEDAAADLVNDYKANERRSTEEVERRIEIGLRPAFGNRRMASIATTDVRAYIVRRQEAGAANATINRELAALKRMFRLAKQAGKLLHVPYIPMLQENNVRSGFFERAAFESVRAHLPTALQPVVTFAYLTGWRTRSEILPLRWHQVNFDAGTVRLEPGTTKNKAGREFIFGNVVELRRVLEDQWAARQELVRAGRLCPYIFHRHAKPIRNFRRAWKSACKAAGCPARIPHDFRRTAVRNLVRAGIPERVAMQMTGHKTRSVFERYNIVSASDLLEASAKLNAALTVTIPVTMPPIDSQATSAQSA